MGKPEMTVKAAILGIAAGERYIVNRIRYRLAGRVIDRDTIAGQIEWYSEEATLGASNPLLAAAISERPYPAPRGTGSSLSGSMNPSIAPRGAFRTRTLRPRRP